MSGPAPFGPEVVAAVAGHMNADHAEDTTRIARAFGGGRSVRAARVVGVDGHGLDLEADGPDGPRPLRVPWRAPLADRAAIRTEVVWLHDEACRRLGVEAPDGH